MQTSKPYKIFGQGRGIDISQQNPQGRNVQPFTGSKKLEQPYERQIQSPFDGYILSTSSSDNNLATSQVSDLNLQLTRRLIKQQLSKFGNFDQSKTKNDIQVMKTQIRTLKQLVTQNIGNNNNNEQLKKDVLKEFDKLLEEYHDQTARNLREVIKKFDESIKKDCTNKFLPLAFINDLEKQLLQLEDKILLVESKVDGNKKRPSQDPVVIAEAFQLRLKKNQRQYQSLKKMVSQIQLQINNSNQFNLTLKSKQSQDDERFTQKLQQMKKKFVQSQKQIKNLTQALEDLKKQQQTTSKSIKQLQQFKDQSPLKWNKKVQGVESSDVKQFLQSSKGLTVSSVFDNSSKEQQNYKKLFKSPEKDNLSKKDSTNSVEEATITSITSQPKNEPTQLCYRIDKQNFLLDEDGNYILNDNGKQIQLTQQQIAILRKSTLVKLCQ